MENNDNGEHSIEETEFSVKSVKQLLPVDITLHPIYRLDGMMLVDRYTVLLPFMLNQIQKHLKNDMPISVIVTSSEKMLNNFIENKIYSNPEFIMILDNVIRNSIHCYSVPISIEKYVDERVDLKASLKAAAELKASIDNAGSNKTIKESMPEDRNCKMKSIDRYSILGRITSSASIWSDFELRLSSIELQNRASSMKKRFLNTLNENNSLMELIFKMADYDDSLLIHGVNSSCISIVLGLVIGMSDEDLINLAITAMFSDIGFVNIEKDIFNEHLKGFNDDSVIGNHIKNSLEIIATAPLCRNKSIIFGILEHHEAFNGNGLPAGKRGKGICLFGRILAIVNNYEIYIKDCFHGDTTNLSNIERMICKNKENKYDQDILNLYMKNSTTFK